MSLATQLEQDLKDALKQGRKDEALVLRLLKSALHNELIQKKMQSQTPTDDLVVVVIKREVKKRKEAIISYKQASREDLVAKEQAELDVLEKYLPAQLTVEEITNIAQNVKTTLAATDLNFGNLMKQVMAKVGTQADGQVVAEVVKKILA